MFKIKWIFWFDTPASKFRESFIGETDRKSLMIRTQTKYGTSCGNTRILRESPHYHQWGGGRITRMEVSLY